MNLSVRPSIVSRTGSRSPRRSAGIQPAGAPWIHLWALHVSACASGAAAAPPPARPAHGSAAVASAPQSPPPAPAGVGCCGSGPPASRHTAGKPRIDPADPQRLCGDVPGLKVSRRTARCASRRNKLLEHGFVEISVGQQSLEAGVLLLKFLLLWRSLTARGAWLLSLSCRRRAAASGGRWVPKPLGPAYVGHGMALVEYLLRSAQLVDDLLGVVALAFRGASPGQVWRVGTL